MEEIKLLVFRLHTHTHTHTHSTKQLVEMISKFNEIVGYKINIQKSVTFLCTKKKFAEKEKLRAIYNSYKNKIYMNKFN
jgi:uncharacterized membrane protein affecting hemolysin expression